MTVAVTGAASPTGRSLGDFVVKERIGAGGFGEVYRAVQPALEREAVIKVLHTRLRAADEATQRFLREARLASHLDHPFAAHIYAFGAEPDGLLWIAMELVRGTPLDRLLAAQGPLPLERFLPLFERICEVVHAAHEQGVVHRDLKPANVMVVSRAGRLSPKLLDFGIAKALEQSTAGATDGGVIPAPEAALELATTMVPDGSLGDEPAAAISGGPSLTRAGALMGSPHYMAPEQWLDAAATDARADIYALGVLAFETLTGKVPFTGTSLRQVAMAHARQPVPGLGPGFPEELDGVLARAMAKRADERPQSALELAAAVRAAAGLSTVATPLPRLDETARDAALAALPQPLAEAVAMLDAARSPHHLRDATVQLARAVVRVLGLLALAARTRLGGPADGADAPAARELLRALYRRVLTDAEWLELAAALCAPHAVAPDIHPVPELVRLFHAPGGARAEAALRLERLAGLRERDADGAPSESVLRERLGETLAEASRVLADLAFLADYQLVVPIAAGVAESWMGVRRPARATVALRGRAVAAGAPALLDRGGAAVLSLAPLMQVAAPAPGAPLELFLLEGRGRRGARLVALPAGYEHHDEAVWEWLRAQLPDSLELAESTSGGSDAPYRGLAPFTAADADRFFGRERLVDAVVNRLHAQPLLVVVGPSGAGKSSFVHAGVVPALEGWRALSLRPGSAPLAAVAARLAAAGIHCDRERLARDPAHLGEALRADAAARGPLLLVVDQLEELCTLCGDVAERDAFAAALAGAARAADEPVRVVGTLRDDFLVRVEALAPLRGRVGLGLQILTTPAADDLARILVEPARRLGFEFEDKALPAEMVREVADRPGALALLSFTAAQLWERRDRHFRLLPTRAYLGLGGVAGALARHAEETLAALPTDRRRLVREAFRHLVTADGTRAVLRRGELAELLGGGDAAGAVIEHLVGARLLVASEGETGEQRIEVIHEALFTAWPRLVEWGREDAENARLRDELRAAARQWQERERAAALLWRDEVLAELARWRTRTQPSLTETERAFADASAAAAIAARRRRRRLLGSALAVLAAGVVALAWQNAQTRAQRQEAVAQSRRADEQRARAEQEGARAESAAAAARRALAAQYRDRGRRLLAAGDPVEALAYLVEALSLGEDGKAMRVMIGRAARAVEARRLTMRAGVPLHSLALSPDGKVVAAGGEDGSVHLFDAVTGAPLALLSGHRDRVTHLLYDADGHLWSASVDGGVRSWRVPEGTLRGGTQWEGSQVRCLARSGDGARIVAAAGDEVRLLEARATSVVATAAVPRVRACAADAAGRHIALGDETGGVWRWQPGRGAPVALPRAHRDVVNAVALDAGGQHLVSGGGDGRVVIWPRNQRPPTTAPPDHDGLVAALSFSPDGRLVISAGHDGTARIFDVEQAAALATLDAGGALAKAMFAGSTTRVVTIGADGDAEIWDASTGRLLGILGGHAGSITAVVTDAGGKRAFTASTDGTVAAWELEHALGLRRSLAADPSGVMAVRFVGAGRVATGGFSGELRLFDLDASDSAPLRSLRGPSFIEVVADPDGELLAGAGADGEVGRVMAWGARDDTPRWRSPDYGGPVWGMAFAGDGSKLLIAAQDGHVELRRVDDWQVVASLEQQQPLSSAALSSDGALVATSSRTGAIMLWEVASSRAIRSMRSPPGPAAGVSFSRDGRRLVSAHEDGTAVIWDVATGEPLGTLRGHAAFLWWATFDPDDALVATVAGDGTARLWDAARFEQLLVLPGHARMLGRPDFGPGGDLLAVAGEDGWLDVWELAADGRSVAELRALLPCRVGTDGALLCK